MGDKAILTAIFCFTLAGTGCQAPKVPARDPAPEVVVGEVFRLREMNV
jgi:hypothetical protein